MTRIAFIALCTLAGLSGFAYAADQTIGQKGRMFSSEIATVRKGEALVFLNDDTIPHNVMSGTSGNEFNLGSLAPGGSAQVRFDKAGEVAVICAIHPRMKMSVKITD
jgi:plastocyanin